jgi:hypothetical protein
MAFLQKASNLVTKTMEDAFFRWGKFVARHPYPVICSCLLITAVTSIGFLKFRMEHQANLLWINSDSAYNIHEKWLQNNFKKNERAQILVVKNDNVLTPESINLMFDLHKKIESIISNGKSFTDICARVPIADIFQTKKRKKRQVPDEYEYGDYTDIWGDYYDNEDDNVAVTQASVTYQRPRINFAKYAKKQSNDSQAKEVSSSLPDNIYCDLVSTLSDKCIQTSLLEMWRYDEDLIRTTTHQEIIDAVNLLVKSPWFGYDLDYSALLGGVERNASGHIVSARTAHLIWTTEIPEAGEIFCNTLIND